jgi:hypothetical protein
MDGKRKQTSPLPDDDRARPPPPELSHAFEPQGGLDDQQSLGADQKPRDDQDQEHSAESHLVLGHERYTATQLESRSSGSSADLQKPAQLLERNPSQHLLQSLEPRLSSKQELTHDCEDGDEDGRGKGAEDKTEVSKREVLSSPEPKTPRKTLYLHPILHLMRHAEVCQFSFLLTHSTSFHLSRH